MTTQGSLPRIAVIVGSNRRESINRKLAKALVRLGAGKFEAKFVRIDDLPMFNQDLEANPSPEVVRSAEWKKAADTSWTHKMRPHLRDHLRIECRRYTRAQ